MRARDIPVDEEGALGLCRLLLYAAAPEVLEQESPPKFTREAASTRVNLLERFDRWVARMRQRDRERYLAQASDVFELEQRIRELERRPYY
jgi:hypothetical protein